MELHILPNHNESFDWFRCFATERRDVILEVVIKNDGKHLAIVSNWNWMKHSQEICAFYVSVSNICLFIVYFAIEGSIY